MFFEYYLKNRKIRNIYLNFYSSFSHLMVSFECGLYSAAGISGINRFSLKVIPATMQGLLFFYLPATIIFSMRTEPHRVAIFGLISLPTARMDLNISFKLPAIVISSTGY
ncbi:hypothetical protein HBNCFIEN_01887 [Legionella sp. PC997]|nr:hypothetical protein HBNCFIEN_01887 [Legionella sp. PC997]